jgi:chemotaxis protein CheX
MTGPENQVPSEAHKAWAPVLELSAREVFSLMLGAELTPSSEPVSEDGLNITSMVGLAGSVYGLLSLRCSSNSASLIASKMLGEDLGCVENTRLDAVGEVCNMVAGNFKDKIAGMGNGCKLSVPTVIVGEDYSLRALTNDCSIDVTVLFEGFPIIFSIQLNQ